MIRQININLNAAHPELPLLEATAFVGSPSTAFIRGVPKSVGNWRLTTVRLVATYPDNSAATVTAVQGADGVYTATIPATATSGRVTGGLQILADGTDENGDAVTDYVLGVADIAVFLRDMTISGADGVKWYLHYFDAVPQTPKKGDVAPDGSGGLQFYNGTAWQPFAVVPPIQYPVTDVTVNSTSVMDGTVAKVTLGTAAAKDVPISGNASASQVVMGDDTRLADARTPTAHASTHAADGSDPITPAAIGALPSSAASDFAPASLSSEVSGIEAKIPAQASAQNQLADKDFVNSSVATNTANFLGTYDYVTDLGFSPPSSSADVSDAAIATALGSLTFPQTPTNNDYVFVQIDYTATTPADEFRRFKFNGTAWAYEYTLNNSSFTSDQWNAINSGITSGAVAKLGALPTAQELATALGAKYEKPSGGIPKTDLASGVQTSLGKADTAFQKPSGGIPSSDLASGVQTSLGKADTAVQPSGLAYAIGAAQTISTASQDSSGGTTINYGAATLADRTVNQVAVAASLDELRVSFPAAVSGKVRDFELRLEVGTGSAALTAPAIVVVPPTGETITLENADGAWPTLEDGTASAKGVTTLYFSETAAGKFLLKGEAMKEVS